MLASSSTDDRAMWWETTALHNMTESQWESLCDGCGLCCMIKVWSGTEIKTCKVGCKLLDIGTACCKDYDNRHAKVSNCVKVTPDNINTPGLLPQTCAYKLLQEGKPLYPWHHLVSGSRQTVVDAGISIIGWAEVNENDISITKLADYAVRAIDY